MNAWATRFGAAVTIVILMSWGSSANAAPIELVQNGGFETGNFLGWSTMTTGTPFLPWSVSTAGATGGFLIPTSPQDGAYDAWNGFDGGGPMTFSMYQDVAIPVGATAALLSWDDRLQWDFTLTSTATVARTYDVQIVDPVSAAVLATLYSFSTGTARAVGDTGWQAHSADLAAFTGQTVRLLFTEFIPENFTGPGQAEFDAISIMATTPVPEPASLPLLALGLAALLALKRGTTRIGQTRSA